LCQIAQEDVYDDDDEAYRMSFPAIYRCVGFELCAAFWLKAIE